jgi:hypothetical protein
LLLEFFAVRWQYRLLLGLQQWWRESIQRQRQSRERV